MRTLTDSRSAPANLDRNPAQPLTCYDARMRPCWSECAPSCSAGARREREGTTLTADARCSSGRRGRPRPDIAHGTAPPCPDTAKLTAAMANGHRPCQRSPCRTPCRHSRAARVVMSGHGRDVRGAPSRAGRPQPHAADTDGPSFTGPPWVPISRMDAPSPGAGCHEKNAQSTALSWRAVTVTRAPRVADLGSPGEGGPRYRASGRNAAARADLCRQRV